MKRILAIFAALAIGVSAFADEGMWMLPLLQKMNSKQLIQLGCRLTPDQIYSINHSSLKDAIVQFGGGCTGEMISENGLLITNHHCGYSSIQGLSTDEHNYLEDGYWAMDKSQELPVPGLSVTFLVSMTDVTPVIEKAEKEARKQFKGSEDLEDQVAKAVRQAGEALRKAAEKDNPNTRAVLEDFYNDNVQYLIIYKTYRDVRFVGAPPASMGKFGGETDNWMWPRHTCDFSMFRVYAGADNEPAAYSADNVPFTPKQSLKISLRGYKDGDYTMIMGYPGSTQRFQTAEQLKTMVESNNIGVKARTLRQDIMWEAMEADPSVRLKYANKYAGSANGWKKWQGEDLAFKKLNIIGREEQKEADFTKWVNAKNSRKEKYGKALEDINSGVVADRQAGLDARLFIESLMRIELTSIPAQLIGQAMREISTGKDTAAALQAAFERVKGTYKDYYEPLDRKEASALMKFYRENATPDNYPSFGGKDFATLDIDAFVKDLFDSSAFTSAEKAEGTVAAGLAAIQADPAYVFYNDALAVLMKIYPASSAHAGQIAAGSKAFAAGLMEWKKGEPSYPDANFTMRLTYGTVKPYSPKDGISYWNHTTLAGVFEKEDPDNYEFRVPAKLKTLWENKDFGNYLDKDGTLHTCFLSNNDITGGNSGSPVLDADGCLIGLAFDGNWESMSSDVMFEPDLQRCINVDIRYVLFMIDRFGGAGYLLDEMTFVK
ncbi:MAG: S46 family peptidase [Bacteroidales bacterium]|nr:S46 family peptidase [Bacteroidales bacterium]MBQ4306007.1 S46 family peptidase [Bacteroidales bacterium]